MSWTKFALEGSGKRSARFDRSNGGPACYIRNKSRLKDVYICRKNVPLCRKCSYHAPFVSFTTPSDFHGVMIPFWYFRLFLYAIQPMTPAATCRKCWCLLKHCTIRGTELAGPQAD